MKLDSDVLLTSTQVCRATGLTVLQLSKLIRSGRFTPKKKSKGRGHQNIFTVNDLLALAMLLALDERGVHPGATAMVIEYLRSADLEIEMTGGKRLLLTYDHLAYRKLMRPEDVQVTLLEYASKNADFEWSKCKIIDLQGALDNVHRTIEQLADEPDASDAASLDGTADEAATACHCQAGAAT